MSSTQKLTKKQKKSLAFRDRKQGKAPSKGKEKAKELGEGIDGDDENLSVPAMEIQDMDNQMLVQMEADANAGNEILSNGEKKHGGKRGRDAEGVGKLDEQKPRKRKREKGEQVEMDGEEESSQSKKKRKQDGSLEQGESGSREDVQVKRKKEVKDTDRRYILFVGNLKYSTSINEIQVHFSLCDPPPTVRLLTPKPSAQGKKTSKSKGCAFLEFSHKNALQQALKLHQSELDGRKINVELTVGGGGKSEGRLTKVKTRNQELHGQRKKQAEKLEKASGVTNSQPTSERPQRYSKTSGVDKIEQTKRTWTVGDAMNDEVHRGGIKHASTNPIRKRRPLPKPQGTGVNLIPVG